MYYIVHTKNKKNKQDLRSKHYRQLEKMLVYVWLCYSSIRMFLFKAQTWVKIMFSSNKRNNLNQLRNRFMNRGLHFGLLCRLKQLTYTFVVKVKRLGKKFHICYLWNQLVLFNKASVYLSFFFNYYLMKFNLCIKIYWI